MRPTLTHLAMHVPDLPASIAFYQTFCGMQVVHERAGKGSRIVWMAEPGQAQRHGLADGVDLERFADGQQRHAVRCPAGAFASLGDALPDRGQADGHGVYFGHAGSLRYGMSHSVGRARTVSPHRSAPRRIFVDPAGAAGLEFGDICLDFNVLSLRRRPHDDAGPPFLLAVPSAMSSAAPEYAFATPFLNPPASPIRSLMPYAMRPGTISLAGGYPAQELFDVDGLTIASTQVLARLGACLQYSNIDGQASLRNELARLSAARGLHCNADTELAVTGGSQQAMALLTRVMLQPGDHAVIESPAFPNSVQALRYTGATVHTVPSGPDGVDIDPVAELHGATGWPVRRAQP